ncbi:MAG: response regulator transcription factor, partial [Thermoanaerobaculia bacterium]
DYVLISVESGYQALDKLESAAADLVIADVHMPGASGYEVCRESKQRAPDTPVMLLVGTFESYDEDQAEAAGADEHLKKPFDSQDLLSRVRELLSRNESDAGSGAESESATAAAAEDLQAAEAAAATPESADDSDEPEDYGDAGGSEEPEPEEPAEVPAETTDKAAPLELSDETVDRIARRVVELLSEEAIRDVAWEVIPDLAEVVIKERLHELESQVE